MRRPSTEAELYDWHARALRGEPVPIHVNEPHCGWFKTKFVRGGPWVPARVWCAQEIDPETGELTGDETLLCEVDGQRRDPVAAWVSFCGGAISRAEYEALLRERDVNPTMAATMVRVDLSRNPVRP